ncbi:MAG: SDR family oxidoreductase [Rhodospirillaceae bacterium]|jgi:2-dehydro-3-deoxy-L-rhamnonate dehydrogenase (NAD+)|nr:SDR family oxidoreductase [Rhodospirillaceae bacterium]MBT6119094.1 SDR family oxidoreductase [Rhodospirillaceae bacterium]
MTTAAWDIGSYGLHSTAEDPYVAAVVGAASGIGREAAALLARLGCAVPCLDRDEAGNAAAAAAIRKAGGAADAFAADVTRPETVHAAVAAALDRYGRIDALVNCAGVTGKTAIVSHEVDLEDFDRVYAINLRGALVVSQAVLPAMLERGYGRLLHVASVAGKDGNAGMAAYSATKAGLIGLVKVMGKDYAQTGVTVNGLAPAVVQTPMVEALPRETVDYMTAKIPMARLGRLDEVAHMIAWILSPACSFTTGFTFDMTGGRATY